MRTGSARRSLRYPQPGSSDRVQSRATQTRSGILFGILPQNPAAQVALSRQSNPASGGSTGRWESNRDADGRRSAPSIPATGSLNQRQRLARRPCTESLAPGMPLHIQMGRVIDGFCCQSGNLYALRLLRPLLFRRRRVFCHPQGCCTIWVTPSIALTFPPP